MLLSDGATDAESFEEATGWAIKPEGACKGDLCVPLPESARREDGSVDPIEIAERLGMPVLRDDGHDVTALGPATVGGRALESAVAPELELPDAHGNPFTLSSLHGKKVLLVAWASW